MAFQNGGRRRGLDYAPIILTLKLDPEAFARFDGLRRLWYPAERNLIPAHVTLFHHLPGTRLPELKDDLKRVCRDRTPFRVEVAAIRSIGRGVAYMLRSPELEELRGRLADLWSDWLIPQDREGFRPHVTVQNKVDPKVAKDTLARLSADFRPATIMGEGLLLWRYRDGPWETAGEVVFRGR